MINTFEELGGLGQVSLCETLCNLPQLSIFQVFWSSSLWKSSLWKRELGWPGLHQANAAVTLPAPSHLLPSPLFSFTYRHEQGFMESTPEYHVLSFRYGENPVLENSLRGEGRGWE